MLVRVTDLEPFVLFCFIFYFFLQKRLGIDAFVKLTLTSRANAKSKCFCFGRHTFQTEAN